MTNLAWEKLGIVLLAMGIGLVSSLLAGLVIVPFCRTRMFISRESKEGVARGRKDIVPMGGGFIILFAVTVVVIVGMATDQVRRGYAGLFAFALWSFAALGLQDDLSKVRARGLSDRAKLVVQFGVLVVFATFFYWYGQRHVPESDLGILTIPFFGEVSIRLGYIAFIMVFMFGVSNAVNFTDGFNGLAGGVGAVVALAFVVVTFLAGLSELDRAVTLGREITLTGSRMFSLSLIAAGLAGALLGYLYFNWRRGSIYFGDTGSMALGASLAFLALFARAEVLMLVIGGVYTAEMLSSGIQRLWDKGIAWGADPFWLRQIEPTLPFVMAPLHHHFETIALREQEDAEGSVPPGAREAVRGRLTKQAWVLSLGFAALGVAGQYARYRGNWAGYNWACSLGLLAVAALLLHGVVTRLKYDCYFIAPDRERPEVLTLYRGVPWRLFGRRWFAVYQTTNIPLDRLGYLERRTALFALQTNRVDARTAFGLLHYGMAQRASGEERREHLRAALSYWTQVPTARFRSAGRQDVLRYLAVCHRELGRWAKAVDSLEDLYAATNNRFVLAEIRAAIDEAISEADTAWGEWRESSGEEALSVALRGHEELAAIIHRRMDRAGHVLVRLRQEAGETPAAELAAVQAELDELGRGLAVAEHRCEQLRAAAGSSAVEQVADEPAAAERA